MVSLGKDAFMWEIISTNDEILKFMDKVCYFHDSCIKEISYISGAYVGEKLSMHPLNDRRVLRVVIQRQYGSYTFVIFPNSRQKWTGGL